MKDTANKYCSEIFDVLQHKRVRNVVCSPGSRNIPLLMAAAARPFIKKHFVYDERSAAFFGLGLALVSQEPVALLCTSGTALLNYGPAVAEAFYQGVPLIVVSADRPVQWIDQDDSQTLWQEGVFANFVKATYSIPPFSDINEEMMWFVNRTVNDAVIMACDGKPGPVHINVHIGEPLGLQAERSEKNPRIINSIRGDSFLNREFLKELATKIANSKVMIVAGFGQPDHYLQKTVAEFSEHPNVTVMAETISNLHLDSRDFSVDSVLTAFNDKTLDNLAPDIVLSIGGALVSRKLKEYLRRNSNRCRHWSIGYNHAIADPFMSLALRIETEPSRFFHSMNVALRKMQSPESVASYRKRWNDLRETASEIKNSYVRDCNWSELKAFHLILRTLPHNCNLSLSNGTAVRYAQIVGHKIPHASYCNRGVSGIDGSLSTAVGGSVAYKGKTILITGDLSLAYDLGGLALKETPDRFKIIVIDNQGGGIFRFIPSSSHLEMREEYLCQTPLLPLPQLAEGYGFDYWEAQDEESLTKNLQEFLKSPRKSILKVTCDGIQSAEILKSYMNLKA